MTSLMPACAASVPTTPFIAASINEALRHHAAYARQLPMGVSHYDMFCRQVARETGADLQRRVRQLMQDGDLRGATLHASSGTSGMTKLLLHVAARLPGDASYGRTLSAALASTMLAPGDTVLNLFTAGGLSLLFDHCNRLLEALGVNLLPVGRLDTYGTDLKALLEWLVLARPNVLLGTPTSVLHCLQVARTHGVALDIRKIIFSGEAFSQSRRAAVLQHWPQARIFGLYGQTEAGFIGYATPECDAAHYHVFDDWFFLEAQHGQMLVTSWANAALPLMRYESGDRVRLLEGGHCRCGRTGVRLTLHGRHDTRFNYAGNLVHAQALAECIHAIVGWPVECQFLLTAQADGRERLRIVLDLDASELAPLRFAVEHAVSAIEAIRECLDKGAGVIDVAARTALRYTQRQKTPLLLDLRRS
ncbi:phenylacetate--CoA ligase family protein [Paraburkholderia hayleyella]|uniref:phenylacetate--CoA ligase family protein n=1 Tax=Paraburkholderia hayleyella TaxID=2152889 RepID=UPI001FEB26F4|nr:hypothetical protein [Paraburkholderia hayleyella]